MKENGKMTYNMVRELKHGPMVPGTKVTMDMVGNMALVSISGMMVHSIVENGMRIRYRA